MEINIKGEKKKPFQYLTNALKLWEPHRKRHGERTARVNSQCKNEKKKKKKLWRRVSGCRIGNNIQFRPMWISSVVSVASLCKSKSHNMIFFFRYLQFYDAL